MLLRTWSDTDTLLLHDSCAKELARVISASYQENYRKFEAHVLTSGMKPNANSKFQAIVCFVHNFIWDQREGPWHSAPPPPDCDPGWRFQRWKVRWKQCSGKIFHRGLNAAEESIFLRELLGVPFCAWLTIKLVARMSLV